MKLHGIFFLTTVSILSLFITGTLHSKDEVKLTPDYLASGKWVIPLGSGGTYGCTGEAKFTTNKRFTMLRDCDQDGFNLNASGSYKIQGNTLILSVEDDKNNSYVKKGNIEKAILSDKDSLENRWYLDFESKEIGKVSNVNTRIKEGDSLIIKGENVLATGVKSGTVTAPLKIREKPDPSGKEISFSTCPENEPIFVKVIEKGKEINVYARTVEKTKVGKWDNYWYYVGFYSGNCEGSDFVSGWVFGEFVKLK